MGQVVGGVKQRLRWLWRAFLQPFSLLPDFAVSVYDCVYVSVHMRVCWGQWVPLPIHLCLSLCLSSHLILVMGDCATGENGVFYFSLPWLCVSFPALISDPSPSPTLLQ